MKQLMKSDDFSNEIAADVQGARIAAAAAQSGLRALKDIEMGWVAGGDGQPVWPY